MTAADWVKTGVLMVVVVLLQISFVSPISIAGGHADLVLVIARRRSRSCGARCSARSPASGPGSSSTSARCGTLGLTSLVLTLAGYWTGRFGEATTRSSPHPPLIAVGARDRAWSSPGRRSSTSCSARACPAGELFGRVLLPSSR